MQSFVKAASYLALTVVCVATLHAAPEIGLNITDGSANRSVSGETADGLGNWTDSDNDAASDWRWGDTVLNGSGGNVTATWTCNNRWGAGGALVPDQQLYREYLDDSDATGGSPYTELAQTNDGFGAVIRLTGLADWLASEGALYFRIRAYFCTDISDTSFRPVSILGGTNLSAELIGAITADAMGDGEFPTGSSGSNTRGYGDSELMSADSIVLAALPRSGTVRGTLAAVKVTALKVNPGDYARKMVIRFPGYTATETLTNFPVLLQVSNDSGSFNYMDVASPNGADLCFTADDETSVIPHEIEEWNPGGVSTVWVQAPELRSDTEIYAYWGNANDLTYDADTFDPNAAVAGLAAWYDAGWGVATDGSNVVTVWSNRQGNTALDLDSSGQTKPRLAPNVINGLPVVDFDATASNQIHNAAGQDFHQPNTVFAVVRADAANGGYAFDGQVNGQRTAAFARSGSIGWDFFAGTEITDGVGVNTNGFEVHTFVFYGPNGKHYIDGRLVRSGDAGSQVFHAVILGARYTQTSPLDGAIAEFLLYDGLLADRAQAKIGTYLANKYGLPSSYPDPDSPAYTSDGSTWDEHYLGVWHLADMAASGVIDSSGNEQSGGGSGSPTFEATGRVGPAVDLSGSSQFIDLPDLGTETQATVECWFKGDNFTGMRGLVSQDPWGGAPGSVHFRVEGDDLKAHMNGGGLPTENDQIAVSNWCHAAYTFSGGGLMNLYRDGEYRVSDAGSGQGAIELDVNIGREGGGRYFDGIIDEVRVSDIARSAIWLRTCYDNQAGVEDFISYGNGGLVLIVR